jgi:hypothetical protein
MVPVTTYQQSFYWEPQTTCCTTTPGVAAGVTAVGPAATTPPAGVSEGRQPAQPGVAEFPNSGTAPQQQPQQTDRYYPQPQSPMPPASGGTSLRPAPPRAVPPPRVKLERIVSIPATRLQGKVVHQDNRPWANARLLFVSAERPAAGQQVVTANSAGQFQANLASGSWLVYVPGSDGKPTLHSKIALRADEARQVTLVGR